jgi:hypothetical protein
MDKPALVMNDLKSGVQKGQVALYVLTGATKIKVAIGTTHAQEERRFIVPPDLCSGSGPAKWRRL